MTDDGSFFLSRLRQNVVTRVIKDLEVPEDSSVKPDQMIWLSGPQKRAENIFQQLEIIDSQGNHLKLVTNRFDLSANEISKCTEAGEPWNYFSNGSSSTCGLSSFTARVNRRFTIKSLLR